MYSPFLATNRFGLGAFLGVEPPSDPRAWLLDQLNSFNPRPPTIGSAPSQAEAAGRLADYYAASRSARMRGAPGTETSRTAIGETLSDTGSREDVSQTLGTRRRELRNLYEQSVAARAITALTSPAPFVERLVHFWSNHFAISADGAPVIAMAGSFEFDAVRPNVLGNFGDLLRAVEQHPAMLFYLDQMRSIGPNSPIARRARARGRSRGLNENLAREILELHTLGVRTVYDQADVTELARALTGWTVTGLARAPTGRSDSALAGSFSFAAPMHEPGARSLLGRVFGQGGQAQGQAMLAMLAEHHATARHIATKLARHFVADTPPPSLVLRLERAFIESGGDLPSLYRALIDAPEAWSEVPAKFKTPWEWAISAMRAIGAETFPTPNVLEFISQLGQRVWRPGSPAGFDDLAESWAGPDALMRRVEVAERLAAGADNVRDARAVAGLLFGHSITQQTAAVISRAESPAQGLSLLLVSPEFLRR